MNIPDFVNGIFEFGGSVVIGASIARVLIDKKVRGIAWPMIAFFALWGFWNLYYYPHLDQWLSFAGGVAIVTMNTVYAGLLIYYTMHEG